MGGIILLTGEPGCGKTTLIHRVLEQMGCPAGGFTTREIREAGVRQGFMIVTLDGEEGRLADISFENVLRVGHYGVDLAAVERVAVASIRRAMSDKRLIVIDEIGPMEMLSPEFRNVVSEALNSDCVVLGAIVKRKMPFSDGIKVRPDVTVIEVTADNREALVEPVIALLAAAGCTPKSD